MNEIIHHFYPFIQIFRLCKIVSQKINLSQKASLLHFKQEISKNLETL